MECTTHQVKNHKGQLLEVWLALPKDRAGPHPAIVLCSGLGAEKSDSLPEFAQQFLKAGYAAVMFDYSTFGRSEGEPRHTVIVGDQYQDYLSIVSWTQKHPQIDGKRIIAWGTSFGGMHVTRLLAERHDIVAGIAQCPCVDSYAASRMKPITASLHLTFWAIIDTIGSYFGMKPIYLTMAAKDRSKGPALMVGEEVYKGWTRLHPLSKDNIDPHYNKICARSTLSFPRSRPGLLAPNIKAPYLIIVPAEDTIAPRQAAIDVTHKAPRGELVEVPGGHFDVYDGCIGFEQNMAAQLEFLGRVVPV